MNKTHGMSDSDASLLTMPTTPGSLVIDPDDSASVTSPLKRRKIVTCCIPPAIIAEHECRRLLFKQSELYKIASTCHIPSEYIKNGVAFNTSEPQSSFKTTMFASSDEIAEINIFAKAKGNFIKISFPPSNLGEIVKRITVGANEANRKEIILEKSNIYIENKPSHGIWISQTFPADAQQVKKHRGVVCKSDQNNGFAIPESEIGVFRNSLLKCVSFVKFIDDLQIQKFQFWTEMGKTFTKEKPNHMDSSQMYFAIFSVFHNMQFPKEYPINVVLGEYLERYKGPHSYNFSSPTNNLMLLSI